MRNATQWKPSKFVRKRGMLRASRDPREVGISSRLIADRVAALYGEHIPRHCRGRLVDLGCGKVPLYAAYRPHTTEVTCVDWAESLHGSAYVDVQCDLTRRLPFTDGSFDTVILSDVLEHLPQPETMWDEMGRILVPGGKVLLNVPFFYPLHEQPHDYYRYTEYALRRFATNHGFRVVHLAPVGGAPDVLADLVAKNAVRIPFLGKPIAISVQRAAWHLGRTRAGRRLSERSGATFPLGYFMIAERMIVERSEADGGA